MEYRHAVTARIWEPIEPIARGERYEDPLQAALQAAQLGTVDGGGSQLTKLGEVQFAELELHLANLDAAVDLATRVLEEAGAPQGSELRFNEPGRSPVGFGTQQGLAIKQIEDALGLGGKSLRGSWGGPEETSLYFYGADAEHMFRRLEPLLLTLPICQNARVVLRHGNPELGPQTVRLPRKG